MVERVVVGPWKTNCYIYSSTKKECIIIDPGGSDEEIASRVDVLNMVPVGIALTHGHVDHLAALRALRDGYAARGYKLPIAINPADRKFLGSGGIETHRENLEFLGLDEATFFGGDDQELPKADVRLREGDRVFSMDLVVLETPGHTPGSVCFYSEREGVLFSGDTLFFDGVGRSDMAGGSEKKLRESIQKKIAVLPPETRVFPGHGPFTTVEREKRGNPYFRDVLQEVRPAAAQGPSLPLQRPSAVVRTGVPRVVDGKTPAKPAARGAARLTRAAKAGGRPAGRRGSKAGSRPAGRHPSKPGTKPGSKPARKGAGRTGRARPAAARRAGSAKKPAARKAAAGRPLARKAAARKPAAKKPAVRRAVSARRAQRAARPAGRKFGAARR